MLGTYLNVKTGEIGSYSAPDRTMSLLDACLGLHGEANGTAESGYERCMMLYDFIMLRLDNWRQMPRSQRPCRDYDFEFDTSVHDIAENVTDRWRRLHSAGGFDKLRRVEVRLLTPEEERATLAG